MQFDQRLLSWHDQAGRHQLPWQLSDDPYQIWISEIMLQQTQVVTVIPYFKKFIARFPTVDDLAIASNDDVSAHWSGLGYYSRARNMHKSAEIIVEKHQGQLPNCYESLLALPGIGQSTASAIMAQAFHQPYAILDGNVKRVLARIHAIKEPVDESKTKNTLQDIANSLMPNHQTRQYTQAIMDLGALVCTKKPNCSICPMQDICSANLNGLTESIPIKKRKVPVKEMTIHLQVMLNSHGQIAMRKRPEKGIWGSLWCFPELAAPSHTNDGLTFIDKHLLTHRKLTLHFHLHHANQLADATWLYPNEIQDLGIPQPVRKNLTKIWKMFHQTSLKESV